MSDLNIQSSNSPSSLWTDKPEEALKKKAGKKKGKIKLQTIKRELMIPNKAFCCEQLPRSQRASLRLTLETTCL